MIEYMKHCQEGTLVYYDHGKEIIKHRMPWMINQWCYLHLFSYEGYLKAVKFLLGYSHSVPLYMSEKMMLIPLGRIRDYDMVWINHAAVKRFYVENDHLSIHFASGNTFEIKRPQKSYELQVMKLEKIRNTKVKHFH